MEPSQTPPGLTDFTSNLATEVPKLFQHLSEMPRTLVHGDLWINNITFIPTPPSRSTSTSTSPPTSTKDPNNNNKNSNKNKNSNDNNNNNNDNNNNNNYKNTRNDNSNNDSNNTGEKGNPLRLCVLDWQTLCWGPGLIDLATLIDTSKQGHRYGKKLLQLYYDTLLKYGVRSSSYSFQQVGTNHPSG